MRPNEPAPTPGISEADIAACVDAIAGLALVKPVVSAFAERADPPPVIARATVSAGVIRDAILRTARAVAPGRRPMADRRP